MTYDSTMTVRQLLDELKQSPGRIVIELNQEILHRNEFDVAELADGDRLEILQFVAGG